jgi:hypothetical protein
MVWAGPSKLQEPQWVIYAKNTGSFLLIGPKKFRYSTNQAIFVKCLYKFEIAHF